MTKISGEQDLENTYKLASPADIVDYYRGFATSCETGFAQEMGWNYPKAIAGAYRKQATADDAPVADIGCGTGIVAAELRLVPDRIDGIDISPEMLEAMARQGEIGPMALEDIATYAKPGHTHSDDRALVLQFRKL